MWYLILFESYKLQWSLAIKKFSQRIVFFFICSCRNICLYFKHFAYKLGMTCKLQLRAFFEARFCWAWKQDFLIGFNETPGKLKKHAGTEVCHVRGHIVKKLHKKVVWQLVVVHRSFLLQILSSQKAFSTVIYFVQPPVCLKFCYPWHTTVSRETLTIRLSIQAFENFEKKLDTFLGS